MSDKQNFETMLNMEAKTASTSRAERLKKFEENFDKQMNEIDNDLSQAADKINELEENNKKLEEANKALTKENKELKLENNILSAQNELNEMRKGQQAAPEKNKDVNELLDKHPELKEALEKVAQKEKEKAKAKGESKEAGGQGFDLVAMVAMIMQALSGNSAQAAPAQERDMHAHHDVPRPEKSEQKDPKGAGASLAEGAAVAVGAIAAAANENVLEPLKKAAEKLDKDFDISKNVENGIAAVKDAAASQFVSNVGSAANQAVQSVQENASTAVASAGTAINQAMESAKDFFTSPAMERRDAALASLDKNIDAAMREVNSVLKDNLDKNIDAAIADLDKVKHLAEGTNSLSGNSKSAEFAEKMGLKELHDKLEKSPEFQQVREMFTAAVGIKTGIDQTSNIQLMAGGPTEKAASQGAQIA